MLRKLTIQTLSQLVGLCEQIEPNAYSTPLDILNGSTIGQHVRHILEFYDCLACQCDGGIIDYDKRVRNKSVEQDPFVALSVLDGIIAFLDSIETSDNSLTHLITYGDTTIEALTSLDRELIYLIEHSIHHYAILQIAIKNAMPEIVLPQNFGYAYSTIKYNETPKSETPILVHQHA